MATAYDISMVFFFLVFTSIGKITQNKDLFCLFCFFPKTLLCNQAFRFQLNKAETKGCSSPLLHVCFWKFDEICIHVCTSVSDILQWKCKYSGTREKIYFHKKECLITCIVSSSHNVLCLYKR